MPDPQDLTARYQLKQLLNWTGSARTFRGSHPTSGEPVAVKLLSLSRTPGAYELGRRFENLARVLQALSHPSLPRVVEFGLTPTGDGFLVTRWIEGKPLAADGTMEPAELIPLLLQVIEALETVSLHSGAHLNVSPDNLVLQNDGLLRILGWGTSLLTVDWQTSPEQKVDAGPANPWSAPELFRQLAPGEALWRADLYSIALIATTLLGAHLEDRSSPSPTVRFDKSLSGRLKQPEQLRAQLERCLRRRSAERPDTYAELARALQHAMPRGAATLETQPVEKIEKVGPGSGATSRPEMDPSQKTTVLPRQEATTKPAPPPADTDEQPALQAAPAKPRASGGGSDRTVVLRAAAADVTGVRRPAQVAVSPTGPPADPPPGPPPGPLPMQRTEVGRPPASVPPASPPAAPAAVPPAAAIPPTSVPPAAGLMAAVPSAAAPLSTPPSPAPAPTAREGARPPSSQVAASEVATASRAAAAPPKDAAAAPGLAPSPAPAPGDVVTREVASPAAPARSGVPPIVWLAIAAVLLLFVVAGAIAVVWWLRTRSPPAREVVVEQTLPGDAGPAIETVPEEAPAVPLPELLEQALIEIGNGELLKARSTLAELSNLEEEGGLPAEVSLAYYSVVETLRRARAEEVKGQLGDGLRRYDLGRLNSVLRAMNGDEERVVAATDEGRRLLNRSRAVLSTANSLEQALREGRLVDALEGANRLEQDDPELADALVLRARAAEGIEESIDALIAADRMEEADQRLRDLERLWPGRAGSAGRRETIRSRLQSQERYESLLAAVAAAGERGRPHEGLERIAGVEVPPEYRERLGRLEQELSAQLRESDRQPPQIQLVEQDPEYRRNEPVLLEFQVTDDYEVLEFSVRARRANATSYEEVALEDQGGGRFRVELSPSFHDNRPILLWAEARDRRGNVTRLAGPESPIELRRGGRRRR